MNKPKLKNKNEKGITLVALVITIIVLLILAGVAINMAINSDGLFGKANEAVEGWNTAVENEKSQIQNLLDELEIDPPGVVSAQGVSLDKTSVNVVIGKTVQITATVTPSEATNKNVTWSSSDETKVTVDENGVVTGISEGTATITVTTESKNKTATCSVTVINPVASYVTETSTIAGVNKTRTAPIPVGFTASQIGGTIPENTISGGLVIYQIPEGATVDWENSKITLAGESVEKVLQETVNQYVWIPVDDVNQMVMCKSNNKDADTEGNKICNIELVDGVLQCTNTAHTANATNLCGRLYGTSSTTADTSTPKTYTTSMNFADRTQTWTDNSGYREPDIVSSYDKDDTDTTTYMATAGISSGKVADFQTQLTTDFNLMATSVAKYGGFYVSRYEAGENGASLKNQVVITAASSDNTARKGLSNWYGLYNAVHNEITVGTSTMQSHMIYGSQYDQIINFIGSEAQTGHPGNVVTSQSLTGTKPEDRLNNIFDLEGNNYEWTAQASDTDGRVSRGAYCNGAGDGFFYPASRGSSRGPTTTTSYSTTRLSLYL